jgi:hypothetical protein
MACKGVVFALELGLLSLKEKTAIRNRIEAAGGTVSPIVGSSVRVLLTTATAQAAGGYKIESAKSHGISIFLVDDLDEVLAFPPSPRQVELPASRTASSRIGVAPAEKKPLIQWDEPLAFPDPSPSSYDSSPSFAPTEYAPSASSSSFTAVSTNDSDELFSGFDFFDDSRNDLFSSQSFSDEPSSRSSPAAAAAAASTAVDDDADDGIGLLMMDFGDDDYVTPISVQAAPKPVVPKPTAKELLEQKLAKLAKTLSPEAFKSLTAGSSSLRASRPTYRFGVSSSVVESTPTSSQSQEEHVALKKQPSDAMAARAAKYQEITSKSAAPLAVTPIRVSQPSFTPLNFDLKPATTKTFVPRFGVSSRSSSSSSSAPIAPIVFETLAEPNNYGDVQVDSSASTPLVSPRSSVSLVSSRASSVGTISERSGGAFDGASVASSADVYAASSTAEWVDEDEDGSDAEEDVDVAVDFDESYLTHREPMAATAPTKRRKVRQPRQYLDRRTGVTWQRKNTRKPAQPLNKLILESGSGVTKVFKLNESATLVVAPAPVRPLISAAPSVALASSGTVVASGAATIQPFNAASLDEFGPPLPRSAPSKVVKKVLTGPVSNKFSWADIVTGKASTTKRVPAMDGLKVFVSGITFDDLKLHGQSREAQLPAHKAEHLKKIKEKNEKALRKLRKKSRKAALAKATADEEGKLIPAAAAADSTRLALPKQSDGAQLARMKTDEQLLNEIVVWPQRRVDAAIALRQSLYRSIFTRFGEVTQFKPEWDKGFIHITYKNTLSAKACLRALKDFDLRNACLRSISEANARTPDIRAALPSPSFYVRWTTCYQRKLTNKTKKAADEKQKVMDAAVAKHASQAASDVAKIPNKL